MKILILSDSFPPNKFGGAEGVSFELSCKFKEFGHKVYVITTVQEKSQTGESDEYGLKIFRIYANYHERWRAYLGLCNPQTVDRVKRILKQVRPDVVHAHNVHYYLSYACLRTAGKYSQAVFLTAHEAMLFHYGKLIEYINPDDLSIPKTFNYKITPWQQIKRFKRRYNPFRNVIIRHYLKYVDKIFAVSYALKRALNQNNIENVEVIHNGVDAAQWQVSDEKLKGFKKKYNLLNKKIVFFVGRLNHWKGREEIIRAMRIVIKQVPEAVLLVAAKKDNYADKIMGFARKENVSLVLTDWIEGDELKSAYHSSDIVVTPSIYLDSFNLINIEAMACKKPVIGTCFGGTAEIIVDNNTGYIVNPLDIRTMAEKIIDLFKKPDRAENFGLAGYNRVRQKFSLKKQAERYLEEFKSQLKK